MPVPLVNGLPVNGTRSTVAFLVAIVNVNGFEHLAGAFPTL
jgi:hypothetical protein